MQRYRLKPDIRFRQFPPEWVVLKQASGEALVVNDVAGRILEVVSGGPRSAPEVAQALSTEFDAPLLTLERDVTAFLKALERDAVVEAE